MSASENETMMVRFVAAPPAATSAAGATVSACTVSVADALLVKPTGLTVIVGGYNTVRVATLLLRLRLVLLLLCFPYI